MTAKINGFRLHTQDQTPEPQDLRQRAYAELLRQAAQAAGLLDTSDVTALDGVQSAAASQAIEALLEQELCIPAPDEGECRRYYAAHPSKFRVGEKVLAQHILFAVTPGVDVNALRQRAEGLLVGLRCESDSSAFSRAAKQYSNCPSGAQGGLLGWLTRADCAPEFSAALFAQDDTDNHIGVLPRLVSTRFGFHIVEVLERDAGLLSAFETVRVAIASSLSQRAYITALRQYLSRLVAQAEVEGLELEAAHGELLQ